MLVKRLLTPGIFLITFFFVATASLFLLIEQETLLISIFPSLLVRGDVAYAVGALGIGLPIYGLTNYAVLILKEKLAVNSNHWFDMSLLYLILFILMAVLIKIPASNSLGYGLVAIQLVPLILGILVNFCFHYFRKFSLK